MSSNDAIEVEGLVLELLGWWKYKVHIPDLDMEVEAYSAWKMKRFRITVIPWDLVTVELNPYEPTKGRIVYRTINKKSWKWSKWKWWRSDWVQKKKKKEAGAGALEGVKKSSADKE